MNSSSKPVGYNCVSPYFVVYGVAETSHFSSEYGRIKLRRFPNESEKPIDSEVRINDRVVMIAEVGDGWPSFFKQKCDRPF
ncbi:hypothetical protein [Microcoleus asticus]|uniref:SH3 domain-containing protein n=1 Tax=Microcoleus asticus IPMA8 TaxID=2563858 RepID=A0ABX2CZI9_9CYAN|nr:hypothetical protein [Microcoleus asticus]NQE35816.1 hypothetical protein [Microcoleus asticus IPMA8]